MGKQRPKVCLFVQSVCLRIGKRKQGLIIYLSRKEVPDLSLQPASQGFLIRHCQINYFGDLSGNIKGVRKNNLPALLHDVFLAFFFVIQISRYWFQRRVKFPQNKQDCFQKFSFRLRIESNYKTLQFVVVISFSTIFSLNLFWNNYTKSTLYFRFGNFFFNQCFVRSIFLFWLR